MDFVETTGKIIDLATRMGAGMSDIMEHPELSERVDRIPTQLGPYGVDPFGFDPEYLKRVIGFTAWVYRYYFRCETTGVDNIPDDRVLIVANHSGQLPYDAMMISMGVFLEREPPRVLRSMVERFVSSTPFVSTFFARCGQILGTPENARRLLDAGEGLLVFPEGVRGLNKAWKQRYRLQDFGQGFMRLAIASQTPIVPCVVIGAEEQAPSFYNAKRLAKLLGLPALPLSPGMGVLPLPTKYRIHFGEPMSFSGNANDEDEVIESKVHQVREKLQRMIDHGLEQRVGVFW